MPTYEYECEACNHSFEEFQQISARPLKKCPKCGRRKLRRLIGTGAAVIFRGNGFYQTDYRSKEYKDKAKADSASGAKDTSSKDAKSSASSKDTSSDASSGKSPDKKKT